MVVVAKVDFKLKQYKQLYHIPEWGVTGIQNRQEIAPAHVMSFKQLHWCMECNTNGDVCLFCTRCHTQNACHYGMCRLGQL